MNINEELTNYFNPYPTKRSDGTVETAKYAIKLASYITVVVPLFVAFALAINYCLKGRVSYTPHSPQDSHISQTAQSALSKRGIQTTEVSPSLILDGSQPPQDATHFIYQLATEAEKQEYRQKLFSALSENLEEGQDTECLTLTAYDGSPITFKREGDKIHCETLSGKKLFDLDPEGGYSYGLLFEENVIEATFTLLINQMDTVCMGLNEDSFNTHAVEVFRTCQTFINQSIEGVGSHAKQICCGDEKSSALRRIENKNPQNLTLQRVFQGYQKPTDDPTIDDNIITMCPLWNPVCAPQDCKYHLSLNLNERSIDMEKRFYRNTVASNRALSISARPNGDLRIEIAKADASRVGGTSKEETTTYHVRQEGGRLYVRTARFQKEFSLVRFHVEMHQEEMYETNQPSPQILQEDLKYIMQALLTIKALVKSPFTLAHHSYSTELGERQTIFFLNGEAVSFQSAQRLAMISQGGEQAQHSIVKTNDEGSFGTIHTDFTLEYLNLEHE